jgi:hypothetical protein
MARSFLGSKVNLIAHQADEPPKISADEGSARFRQLVICRTRAPEIISLNLAASSVTSATAASLFGFVVAAGGAALSAIATILEGQAIVFAPIWTDLVLDIDANGVCTYKLQHSYFPSATVYFRKSPGHDFFRSDYVYDGTAKNRFECWLDHGWDFPPQGYEYNSRNRACARKIRRNPLLASIKRTNYEVLPPLMRRFRLESAPAETSEARLLAENINPAAKVVPYKNDWILCPNCNKRFSMRNASSWSGERHSTCGQRLDVRFDP